MSIPVIAFFNNKGGVGKTTLVYHISWTFADMEQKVLCADLDPQANLTSSFLDEDQLEKLWFDDDGERKKTIYGALEPLVSGDGDIVRQLYTAEINDYLHLLAGDLELSRFEDELSQHWPLCSARKPRAFRIISAFWRIMQNCGQQLRAQLILVDLGPNLGAINRAALVAADFLVIPLTPDLYSLQGLKNVGPTIRGWREEWKELRKKNPLKDLLLPVGNIQPLGYVILQHSVRTDRPVKAYERWVTRIPGIYASEVMEQKKQDQAPTNQNDPNCLGLVKHYRSLIPMSMEVNKPMFHLLPADGAIGSHYHAVQEAGKNFKQLALEIEKRYKKYWESF